MTTSKASFFYLSKLAACESRPARRAGPCCHRQQPDKRRRKGDKILLRKSKGPVFRRPTPRSTAIRDRVFREALADFVVCIDPHALFEPKTVGKLVNQAEWIKTTGKLAGDLFHGPMLYDYLEPDNTPATHMDPAGVTICSGLGAIWKKAKTRRANRSKYRCTGSAYLLAQRKHGPAFRRCLKALAGKKATSTKNSSKRGKVWCLPWLRWLHRFDRPRRQCLPFAH